MCFITNLFHSCKSVSCHLFLLCFSTPLPSTRPWDPLNDLIQFEKDGCIQTKVRHRTPMVRSGSLISLSNQGPRRDNCKCQVGRPDRKPPSFRKTKAARRLSHLPRSTCCGVFIVTSSLCVTVPPSQLPPLLLFFSFVLFSSLPLAPAVLTSWEGVLSQTAWTSRYSLSFSGLVKRKRIM